MSGHSQRTAVHAFRNPAAQLKAGLVHFGCSPWSFPTDSTPCGQPLLELTGGCLFYASIPRLTGAWYKACPLPAHLRVLLMALP